MLQRWLRRLRHRARPAAAGTAAERLEAAIAAHRARRFETAERLFLSVIDDPSAFVGDRHVARNICGNLYQRTHRPEQAVAMFEANLREGFAGSYPYERLAAIYQRQGRAADTVRVLGAAVAVVERRLMAGQADVRPQLERLRAELAQAKR